MLSHFRSRVNTFFAAAPRHQLWQLMLTGCALFWITAVLSIMSLR